MNNSKNGIKKRHANFLRSLHLRYGNIVLGVSISEIARTTSNAISTTVCYLDRLEEFGYINVFRISANKKRIEIDEKKYKELMIELPTLYK